MSEDQTQHLHELLRSFDTAMLITRHGDEQHGRPMAIATFEGPSTLWFVTQADSPKALEIERDPRVSVTFQSEKRFIALSGIASLVRDRAKIDALWSPTWRAWFPDGKDDPNIALVRVRIEDAEFWDNAGMNGVRYVFEAVRAVLSGEKAADSVDGQHGRVKRNGAMAASRR